MAQTPSARLSSKRARQLRTRFESLSITHTQGQDPSDFVHRYDNPADQEIAALIASSISFGRVASFWGVLDRIFHQADLRGGPLVWVTNFDDTDAHRLHPIFYRWIRGSDIARFVRTIGRVRREYGTVGRLFELMYDPSEVNLAGTLGRAMDVLRNASLQSTQEHFDGLSRGYRYLLPHPKSGSACKRWCMLLRWMVRNDGPDVGLWNLPPEKLIIPLDTHIHRIAKHLRLTHRNDASWRTVVEVTANLRRIDPKDPVRFDFVLAHLGISGTARGDKIVGLFGS